MIRKALTLLWLLFPVFVIAFHYTYGQDYVRREKVHEHLKRIQQMELLDEDHRDWNQIIAEYETLEHDSAGIQSPKVLHQIRLAKARARLEMLDIATAITDLTTLLQEVAFVHGEDAAMTRSVREMLGKAHYHATILLQANNAAEKEWRPFAERSRQLFRFLAEHENPMALADYEQRVRGELDRAAERMKQEGR
jgi:hypothetical protein